MTAPAFETLSYAATDGVAIVHLNRPERLNAVTPRMKQDLLRLFDVTDADDSVRCVVVTGSGRAFCAGADLSAGGGALDHNAQGEGLAGDDVVDGIRRDGGGTLALRIMASLKPVVAAVNGAAVGMGATMLLPMDARLASTDARFGFPFARRGIAPEGCSSWFLPRLVGPARALDWFLTGRLFDAPEALSSGLVRSLHAPDALIPAATALAREIAEQAAPVSAALSRQLVWRMMAADHPMVAHRAESRALQARGSSADAREGIGAFLEKRTPVWVDRVSDGLPDAFPARPEPRFE